LFRSSDYCWSRCGGRREHPEHFLQVVLERTAQEAVVDLTVDRIGLKEVTEGNSQPDGFPTARALTRGVILEPRWRDSNNPSESAREVAGIGKTSLYGCSEYAAIPSAEPLFRALDSL
jgi:hypothetical protein